MAFEFIGSKALTVLQEVSKTDPDSSVRKRAKQAAQSVQAKKRG